MIGAAIGDIIGSRFEFNMVLGVDDPNWNPLFDDSLSKFTDDTVLTMATADAILTARDISLEEYRKSSDITVFGKSLDITFRDKYKEWAKKYPNRGYGSTFWHWVENDLQIKNKSYADGCMMRCSPIGLYWCDDIDFALKKAKDSIAWTHNSPESLRGVSAIVSAIALARQGKSKTEIRAYVEEQFGIWLYASIQEIKEKWDTRNIRCNITCAQALICFLNSEDFESAIRLAIYSGGDCDTIAAICGSLSEAFYGPQSIPKWMIEEAKKRLSPEMIELTNRFYEIIGGYKDYPYKGFII